MYVVFYGFSTYRDKKIVEYPQRARGIKVKGNRPKKVYIHSDRALTVDEKHWIHQEIITKLHHNFDHIEYSKGCKNDS